MQLIVAEKPSVARDLARVLGVPTGGGRGGAFEGEGRVITWCIGHLVELDEPSAYDGRWKAWRMDTLPMLPEAFRLRPSKSTTQQYRAVSRLLGDRRFREVVNACDAGREGELIFRYLYQLAGSRLPVSRLWISSLTDEAVRFGFAALRPGAAYDALGDAARCRSEADWLVGLNATRALTLARRTGRDSPLWSIGRVQTPTLAMLVLRERAIADFRPDDYFEVRARLDTGRAGPGEQFEALFRHDGRTRFARREHADTVESRDGARGDLRHPEGPVVESLRARATREPPPLLFDLTSLQRTANRRFGLSAARTLAVAQALYEQHKILTYPRTDSRHLTTDVGKQLGGAFAALAAVPEYQRFAQPLCDRPPRPGRRVIDDSKVSDHHAIIPTGKRIDLGRLDRDERNVFDLVARRFLGAFYPDAEFAITDVVVRVGPERVHGGAVAPEPLATGDESQKARRIDELPPEPDRYVARGKVRTVAGWQEVAGIDAAAAAGEGGARRRSRGPARGGEAPGGEGAGDDEAQPDEPITVLPALTLGQRLGGAFEVLAKKTQPPPRYTEATLLAAMESAGRAIEDDELRQAMKDTGLGTPATRASIIETLLERRYVERDKKRLVPTPLGMELIETLPAPSLASPELTGSWEARLARVARGQEPRAAFMRDIRGFVVEVVDAIRRAPPVAPRPMAPGGVLPTPTPPAAPSTHPDPPPRSARPPRTGRTTRRTTTRTTTPTTTRTTPRAADVAAKPLTCPRCAAGTLVTGKRGWGCSRWREGCGFVVWFETAGKRLTEAMLRELITRGKTRRTSFRPDGLAPVDGQLVLQPDQPGGARFVPARRR